MLGELKLKMKDILIILDEKIESGELSPEDIDFEDLNNLLKLTEVIK